MQERKKERNIYAAIFCIAFLMLAAQACAEVEAEFTVEDLQTVFKFPLLHFKTPQSLELCGEQVPLERRDVWERLDKQFLLALNREAQVILWLKRSKQYMPYIESELKKRNLPDDLKYIAVAESDLNKYALSPKGAAGTWQFMRHTGGRFGLENKEWTDQRYSFAKATDAALTYLASLHEQFGQWMLAVAAYNCGEERLAREIEEQKTEQFVDLYLPRETEEYLFRIMAIKIIHSNPEKYGFVLEEQDYYLPFDAEEVEVSVPALLHMQIIAEAAQTNFRTIKELNPDLRGYYLPRGKHTLLIPRQGVEEFAQRLSASLDKGSEGIKSTYVVKEGDSLSAIAQKLAVPLPALMKWNGITKADMIFAGQKLVYFKPEGS